METTEEVRLLSYRQRRIFDYVTSVITREDRSPSLREIMEACDMSSTSVVDYNIDRLVARGLLVKIGLSGDNRRIQLPVNPWRQLVEDANVIFGHLDDHIDYGGVIGGQIADWRGRRAKLIRG